MITIRALILTSKSQAIKVELAHTRAQLESTRSALQSIQNVAQADHERYNYLMRRAEQEKEWLAGQVEQMWTKLEQSCSHLRNTQRREARMKRKIGTLRDELEQLKGDLKEAMKQNSDQQSDLRHLQRTVMDHETMVLDMHR